MTELQYAPPVNRSLMDRQYDQKVEKNDVSLMRIVGENNDFPEVDLVRQSADSPE